MGLGSWAGHNKLASAIIVALSVLLVLCRLTMEQSREELEKAQLNLLAEHRHSAQLRQKSKRLSELLEERTRSDAVASSASNAAAMADLSAAEALGASTSAAGIDANELLEGHRRWDWKAIAKDFLQRWPTIEAMQLDAAVESCYDNGTMYCQRMQVRTRHTDLCIYTHIRVTPTLIMLRDLSPMYRCIKASSTSPTTERSFSTGIMLRRASCRCSPHSVPIPTCQTLILSLPETTNRGRPRIQVS